MHALIPRSTLPETRVSGALRGNRTARGPSVRQRRHGGYRRLGTMGTLTLTALGVAAAPVASRAQISIEASYGVDRNVESSTSELDGRLSLTLDWIFASGFGLGIGTDHQFEGAALSPSEHLGWSLYLTPSFELRSGAAAPFVRGGIGLGRAPCQGDTCGDGAYLRGSTGLRVRVAEGLRILGEIGVSRVSRPFAGAGMSVRF